MAVKHGVAGVHKAHHRLTCARNIVSWSVEDRDHKDAQPTVVGHGRLRSHVKGGRVEDSQTAFQALFDAPPRERARFCVGRTGEGIIWELAKETGRQRER